MTTTPDPDRTVLLEARERLLAQVASLSHAFDDIVEAADGVATDDEHDPEGHTIAFERQQVAALLRDARAHLGDTESALARRDDGSYGRCERCGAAIDPERLDALPAARTCITCARLGSP